MTTYHDYTEGHLTPLQALRALAMEYGEIESDLEPLEGQRAALRDQMAVLLTKIDGEKVEIRGFGLIRLTQAGISEAYDAKALDALLGRLRDEGQHDMADAVLACKAKRHRAGGLRIEREHS